MIRATSSRIPFGLVILVAAVARSALAQVPPAPAPAASGSAVQESIPAAAPAPTSSAASNPPAPPPASPIAAAPPPLVAPAPKPSGGNPFYGYGPPVAQSDEVRPDQVQTEEDQPGKGLGSHQSNWMIGIGGRSMLVKSAGFDPFATSDGFAQFSVLAERTLFTQGNLSLSGAFGWDYGARSSDVRGSPSELQVHRLSLGPELRYHFLPRLYAFVRVSPSVIDEAASLSDVLAGGNRLSEHWVFGADATLGGAFEVFGKRNGASHKPRFWVMAEGGYSWAAPADLAFDESANPGAAPVRMAGVNLGTLSLSGPMIRVGAAVTLEP